MLTCFLRGAWRGEPGSFGPVRMRRPSAKGNGHRAAERQQAEATPQGPLERRRRSAYLFPLEEEPSVLARPGSLSRNEPFQRSRSDGRG